MASKAMPLPLAERADIHKSCKSLETLLGVLNDYCEAAGATVLLQKKLSKALRDAASMKTTGQIAANAMNTSAVIFEVSSDINSRFAKVVDKEYDAISAEVKKWFKKLAKEERMHDERMANANTRIKQAGQMYEKKSKKNPQDATEEHARYLNLITALGPEMSQEKYNHALNVTQRHAATTYSAAGSLSRIADAEWLRTCESVRRYSPTIGQLGEWRSLCEGGWSGPVPHNLPDLTEDQQPQPDREVAIEKTGGSESPRLLTVIKDTEVGGLRELAEQAPPPLAGQSLAVNGPREPPAVQHPPRPIMANSQGLSQDTPASAPPSAYEPQRQFAERNNADSVRTLSAFPLPPTHFPIPPPRQQPSQSQSSQSSSYVGTTRLTESPLPENPEDGDRQPAMSSGSRDAPSSEQRLRDTASASDTNPPSPLHSIAEDKVRQTRSQASLPPVETSNTSVENTTSYDRNPQQANEDHFNMDHEFGVNVSHVAISRSAEAVRTRAIERTDTGGSNGSIVAAMRNRYSNNSGAVSPTQKEAPRLSLSVNDLANRYEPMDGPYPRVRTSSASSRQPSMVPDPVAKPRQGNSYTDHDAPRRNVAPDLGSPRQEEAERRRQQRLNDLAQLDLKEKELELLKREQDIELRAQELQRDRARLHDVHEVNEHPDKGNAPRGDTTQQPYTQLKPRERKISFRTRRPQSQLDVGNSPITPPGQNLARPLSQHAYSTPHLVPPSPSHNHIQPSQSSYNNSQYSRSPASSHTSPQSTSAHAPYCGCEVCSAAKYRSPPSPADRTNLRPLAEPIKLRPPAEKSKPGWIRRLSMPVGNAFSLDSKKGIGNIAAGGGGVGRSGIFSMDGKKNLSSTALRADETGRRSYEASGISNQSMVNLGMGRR